MSCPYLKKKRGRKKEKKSNEFLKNILCLHLLLVLIFSNSETQSFKSHKNVSSENMHMIQLLIHRVQMLFERPQDTTRDSWQPVQKRMSFLQALHHVCQLMRIFWKTQASQRAADTHVWAIERNCLSRPPSSPVSMN